MKKLVHAVVVVMCLFLSGNLMAEECMEGDCDNGFGTGFTADNKIYEGEWKKGLPDGLGKLYVSKGKVIEGRWEKGVLVEEKKVEKKDEDK